MRKVFGIFWKHTESIWKVNGKHSVIHWGNHIWMDIWVVSKTHTTFVFGKHTAWHSGQFDCSIMGRSHWPECHSVCFPKRNLGGRGANGSYSGSIRCVLGAYWLFGSVRMHTERHLVAPKIILFMFKMIFIDHPNVASKCIREAFKEHTAFTEKCVLKAFVKHSVIHLGKPIWRDISHFKKSHHFRIRKTNGMAFGPVIQIY